MKLFELFPDPTDVLNPLDMHDDFNTLDTPHDSVARQNQRKKYSSGENMKKAKQIAARVKLKKKETANDTEETPAQAHLGGHGSSFLFR